MSVFLWSPKGRTPKWAVQWTENGKKVRTLYPTETEAREAESQHKQQNTEPHRLTVAELVAAYLRNNPHKHQNFKKVMVYFLYGSDRDGWHKTGGGEFMRDKYAEHLTRVDLEQMREAVRANGANNGGINRYQVYMRAILAWGVEQQLISINPWSGFKRLPEAKKIVTTTIADIRRVFNCAPSWLQWAIKTAFALALRPGQVELFGLTWDAFVWRRGCVIIRQGKSGMIKTVFPPVVYMEEAAVRYKEDSAAGIPLVCHRAGSRVLKPERAWNKAVKEAGLSRHIPMYHIRHAAATEMLAAGADPASVSAQLGHSSVHTTCTVYAHVTPGGQQRAAELMPSMDNE